MPLFLDTRGRPTLGIGVCSRCSRKFPLSELQPDPNYPGLRVCDADRDNYDPYRLPARQPEDITLPFMRTDTPLPTNPNGIITQDQTEFLVTEDSDDFLVFFGDEEL